MRKSHRNRIETSKDGRESKWSRLVAAGQTADVARSDLSPLCAAMRCAATAECPCTSQWTANRQSQQPASIGDLNSEPGHCSCTLFLVAATPGPLIAHVVLACYSLCLSRDICSAHVNFEREAASAVPDPKLVAEDDYKPSGVSYS